MLNLLNEIHNSSAAIPFGVALVADRERVLGPCHHPDTVISRNDLACAYRWAGRLAESIELFKAAVSDGERVLGRDHPDTLISRNDLAGAYGSAGRLAEAIELFKATVADRERVLGRDHPHTVSCRNNLARAYESAAPLDENPQEP